MSSDETQMTPSDADATQPMTPAPVPPANADETVATNLAAQAAANSAGDATAPTAMMAGGAPKAGDATAPTAILAGDGTAPTAIINTAAVNALDSLVGRNLGGCTVEKLLGRGGMGAVFKAQQQSLGRAVALKVMLPGRDADPQFASRFQREARVVAALNHPHVVQVYDTGRAEDGMLYLIMEFVDGRSLAQVIRDQGPLPVPTVLAIIRQSAEGLAAAHAKALVHRDIKPDNLMIDADARVKVMDFGLARPTEGSSGDSALTMSGMILGTPNYISPEAARGEPADIRADLYSLGVTLWQCIAGKLPFTGPTPVQVLVQHIEAAPPFLDQAVPACPKPVAELCSRLLAKDANQRFATPAALVEAITQVELTLCGKVVRLRWEDGKLVSDATVSAAAAAQAAVAPARPSRSGDRAVLFVGLAALAVIGVVAVVLIRGAMATDPGTSDVQTAAVTVDPSVVVADPSAFPQETATSHPQLASDTPSEGTPVESVVSEPDENDPPKPVAIPAANPAATPTPAVVASIVPTGDVQPLVKPPVNEPAQPEIAPTVVDQKPPVQEPVVQDPPVVAAPVPAPIAAPGPDAPPVPVTPPVVTPPAEPVAPTPVVPAPVAPVPVAPAPVAPELPPELAAVPALIPVAQIPPALPARPTSLFVSSLPSGATVEIDGSKKGTTPCNIPNLSAGEHRLRVHDGKDLDEQTTVVLPNGGTVRLRTPLPEPARLELLAVPAGARVVVDGRSYVSNMAVLTGTVSVQVITADGVKAFTVSTLAGRNIFRYGE